MVKNIIEEKKLSIPEVKEILDKVYARMEKLQTPIDPFTEASMEYTHDFAKMPAKTARQIIIMLMKEYGMEESYAIQIVNIDPQYPQEIKVILEKDPALRNLSTEKLTEMIEKIRDLQI